MKPLSPHDPRDESLDDLIAAALHGELTPEERARFESRLSTDPAAQAAYQEAQAMHDLLEKNYQSAQPDPAFEQRMVSGVRRQIQSEAHRETALESLLALWRGLKNILGRRSLWTYGGVCSVVLVLFLAFAIYSGNQVKGIFTTITSQLAVAGQASRSLSFLPSGEESQARHQLHPPRVRTPHCLPLWSKGKRIGRTSSKPILPIKSPPSNWREWKLKKSVMPARIRKIYDR